MDSMRKFQKENNTNISLEVIEQSFYDDKKVNILSPIDEQCKWLKEIGFTQVDCYFKAFEMAIFGGVKPK